MDVLHEILITGEINAPVCRLEIRESHAHIRHIYLLILTVHHIQIAFLGSDQYIFSVFIHADAHHKGAYRIIDFTCPIDIQLFVKLMINPVSVDRPVGIPVLNHLHDLITGLQSIQDFPVLRNA